MSEADIAGVILIVFIAGATVRNWYRGYEERKSWKRKMLTLSNLNQHSKPIQGFAMGKMGSPSAPYPPQNPYTASRFKEDLYK